MRLFVALELPEDVKARLKAWLGQPKARDWRWTSPDQWHVTLAFLGEVPEGAFEPLCTELAKLEFGTLNLALGSAGGFPDARAAKVAWVGLLGDILTLSRMQQSVVAACKPYAPRIDLKPFHAHVTIGRSRLAYGLPLPLPSHAPVGHWCSSEFSLIKSTVGHEGSMYQTLKSFPASP